MLRSFLNISAPKEGSDEEKKFLEQIDILISEIDQDKEFMEFVVKAVKAGGKEEEK